MINWKEIIENILAYGFKQQDIATYCACSQSTIGMIAINQRGKRISYDLGSKLIEMKDAVESGKLKGKS